MARGVPSWSSRWRVPDLREPGFQSAGSSTIDDVYRGCVVEWSDNWNGLCPEDLAPALSVMPGCRLQYHQKHKQTIGALFCTKRAIKMKPAITWIFIMDPTPSDRSPKASVWKILDTLSTNASVLLGPSESSGRARIVTNILL